MKMNYAIDRAVEVTLLVKLQQKPHVECLGILLIELQPTLVED